MPHLLMPSELQEDLGAVSTPCWEPATYSSWCRYGIGTWVFFPCPSVECSSSVSSAVSLCFLSTRAALKGKHWRGGWFLTSCSLPWAFHWHSLLCKPQFTGLFSHEQLHQCRALMIPVGLYAVIRSHRPDFFAALGNGRASSCILSLLTISTMQLYQLGKS